MQNPTNQSHSRPHLLLTPCIASATPSVAARWRAVTTRDTSANDFVYAVRSTLIYCRPSCPGRLARRANIEFFDTPAQAEAAGYRSCKRCSPHLRVKDDPQVRVVQQARDTIASAISSGQRPKLQELATEANLTPSHFHRVFKKIVGVTPGQYASSIREKGSKGHSNRESQANLDSEILLEPDDSNQLVDLCQVQLGPTNISENSILLDDFIDWNQFDVMMAREQCDTGL